MQHMALSIHAYNLIKTSFETKTKKFVIILTERMSEIFALVIAPISSESNYTL